VNKKSVFCITIIIAATLVAKEKLNKESFIAKPKQKKESRTTILESIATLIMYNAKINPQVIEQAARLEQNLLEHGTQLLAQEKNSFFVTAELNSLQEYRTHLQEISSHLESCTRLLTQSCSKLKKISCPIS